MARSPCDGRSVHWAEEIKKYPGENPEIKLIKIPKGSSYLNLIEACWNAGKKAILPTMCDSKDEMR